VIELNELEEQLQILIMQNENQVKDSIVNLNLGQDGIAQAITEKINGTLKNIFVLLSGDTTNIQLTVFPKGYDFIKIVNSKDIKFSKSFNPVFVDTGPAGTEYEIPSRREYCLNDKLVILAEGPINGEVTVVIRYE